jgi:hypothetical protein
MLPRCALHQERKYVWFHCLPLTFLFPLLSYTPFISGDVSRATSPIYSPLSPLRCTLSVCSSGQSIIPTSLATATHSSMASPAQNTVVDTSLLGQELLLLSSRSNMVMGLLLGFLGHSNVISLTFDYHLLTSAFEANPCIVYRLINRFTYFIAK